MKRCSRCGEVKYKSEFPKRKLSSDGLCGTCKHCRSIDYVKYRTKHREELKRKRAIKYAENPEKYRQRSRDWRKKNPDKAKEFSLKVYRKKNRFVISLQNSERHARKYGYAACSATVEEVTVAFTGFCEICGVPEAECTAKFHMDHCHDTGKFRGWLCDSCNKGLGFFKDSEKLVDKALDFLTNHKRKEYLV